MLRTQEALVVRGAAQLDALSPLKVLGRGYAIMRDGDGHVVSDATKVAVGDDVTVLVDKGSVRASVTEVLDEDFKG